MEANPDMVLDNPHLMVPSTVGEVEQKRCSSSSLLTLVVSIPVPFPTIATYICEVVTSYQSAGTPDTTRISSDSYLHLI